MATVDIDVKVASMILIERSTDRRTVVAAAASHGTIVFICEFVAEKAQKDSSVSESESDISAHRNDQAVDEQWVKVEKRKTKKAKKLDAKLDVCHPKIFILHPEILRRKDPVSINDVRDLVLHIIAIPHHRAGSEYSIQKLVVLLIPGLTSTVLSLPPPPPRLRRTLIYPYHTTPSDPPPPSPSKPPDLPSSIDPHSEEAAALYGGVPFITSTFSHACPTRAPGDSTRMHSVLNTFFQTPVSGEEKKRRIQERISAERTQKKDPAQYLLTVEQMVENDYPVLRWIETPQAAADADGSYKVYAVDCEMCMTNDGKALTGRRARSPTISPAAALDPVTTTLADVQTHLRTLIDPSTILLGHSLESDLRALQLAHPRCVDTAILFHHPRGRPLKPGLAWLTRKWLGRTIQDRGPGGHNPEEDARACIDLLKAKIKNGPGFGEFRADYEPILARIARSHSRNRGSNGARTRTAIVDHGNPGAWHGGSATAPATTIACANDAEVLDGLVGALDSHEFVFGRLMGITPKAENTENRNPTGAAETKTDNAETPSSSPPQDGDGNSLFAAVTDLNAHLTALHAALPPRTALLLFLRAQRPAFDSGSGAGTGTGDGAAARWSTADDRALEEAVARARMGLLFVGVKT
ncbi:hypothetical protein H4582DRAFT_2083191 [Lactarius indigo]|nr:hypothetical protein H4582DRAFT_2083191 [Lactarius indigo]